MAHFSSGVGRSVYLNAKPGRKIAPLRRVHNELESEKVSMVKTLFIAVIAIIVFAAVAYQQGWLSRKGERLYDNAKQGILDKGKEAFQEGKEALQK